MKLSIEDVSHIAKLARLELTDGEKHMYADQLSVVLDYIEMLDEVDTEGVLETCQVTGLEDVVREDVVVECPQDMKEKIKAQFPKHQANLLKVKKVFE